MTNIILKICNIGVYVALYMAVYLFVLLAAGAIVDQTSALHVLTNALAMAFAGGTLAVLLPAKNLPHKKPNNMILTVGSVFMLASGTCVVLNALMGLIPWEKISGAHVMQDSTMMLGIPFWLRIFSYVLAAPLAEEILFRGCIFEKCKEFMPVWVAILISALAFAIYHGNLQQGIYAFLCGCVLAMVYYVTDSFLMSVLFHATANLIVNLAYEWEGFSKVIYTVPSMIVLLLFAVASVIYLCYSCKKQKNNQN